MSSLFPIIEIIDAEKEGLSDEYIHEFYDAQSIVELMRIRNIKPEEC